MAITAAQVKQLREITGSGMMDCKKALTATNGDMDAAVEFLRKNGQAKAEKKASRIAAEGICLIATEGNQKAAVVEVNSETDFVAQNEKFRTYVAKVAAQALNSDAADMDAFMAEAWNEDPTKTVKESLVEMIAVISEKLSIRRFEKVVAENGMLASYVHGGGRIGVIVDAETAVVNDDIAAALQNVAMQIAAMSPKYVCQEEIPQDYRDHEKEILLAQALKENDELPENKRKPQNIIEKMLIGRLNKQFKEICLNDQIYVRAEDGKQTVAQYLAQVGKANGTTIKVKKFVRFETGEGIEKRVDNFAEEVMAQVKG
ncbi:MAG: elongation factor Ts [Lachnospiraceae bacterium]|jgi:elongation factor Ts|nr:elongation factor Ts [Lachnospiraceae bacterium]MBQ5359577.1 elongation factor Ts [Lachnospiraceae bacterium]